MSCYVVGKETIDRITTLCLWVNKGSYSSIDFLEFVKKYRNSEEVDTQFGKLLLKMNIKAFNQRYEGSHKEDESIINKYSFENRTADNLQYLKTLMCFLYQCSEGTVPKMKLYKMLELLKNELAFKVIEENIPEFEKKEWA